MRQIRPFRVHTQLDYPQLLEMHRVVDGVLAPNCLRKKQRFNISVAIIDVAVGAFCFQASRQIWVAVLFGVLAALFLAAGIFYFRIAALTAKRQMDKRTFSTDYTFDDEEMRGVNARGEAHYPYENCSRLVETEGNLYFVTARGEVVMLAKGGLQGGTAEELREFLQEKCGRTVETVGPDWKVRPAAGQ